LNEATPPPGRLLNWWQVRNFVPHFITWYFEANLDRHIQADRINGDGLVFAFQNCTDATLLLEGNNHTLHKRTVGRLIGLNPDAGKSLLGGCDEEYWSQLYLVTRPIPKETKSTMPTK
jgi:hypothetical protein